MVGKSMSGLSYRFNLILSGAWRQRYIIVIPMLLFPIFGLIIGISSNKKYQNHTSMLIQETSKMNPFLEDFAISAMLKERKDALKTLLHSRHILGSVAQERKLVSEITPSHEIDRIIQSLSSSLLVSFKGKDLIRIDYTTDNPADMKETLESISQHFIEQLLAPERSSISDSSRFLSQHLEYRKNELEVSESALAAYKNKNATELPELHLSNISRLTKLKQRLSEKESELAGAIKTLGSLDQQLSKTNPVIGVIEEKIVQIQSALALYQSRYTNRHSKIVSAKRKLKRLEEERRELMSLSTKSINTDKLWDIASIRTVTNDSPQPLLISQLENLQFSRSRVVGLKEETSSLHNTISSLEKNAKEYGEQEKQLLKLERDLEVKMDLYNELLTRHEMAKVTGSLGRFEQDKRVKIIDKPFTPSYPSNFPTTLFIIFGMIAGIIFGGGIALLIEVTDTTLRTRNQLEELLNVPVLSRIPPLPSRITYS